MEEAPRKRKLNVFDFLKGATETLPTTVVQPGFKRRREDVDTVDVDGETQQIDDETPSLAQVNHVGFTLDPMTFTRAQETLPIQQDETTPETHDQLPKLSYSEVETLSNVNSSRTGFNNFKGKKYGLGASLLQKMGWVPGKGLGATLQGITEPIEMGEHRQGAGIGASLEKAKRKEKNRKQGNPDPEDLSDEESSDEEYYKEVPKKSLYQLIVEIESLGVVKVPHSIKELSNKHSSKAKKTFIELRKEGGDEHIEQVTTSLDSLYNDLSNLVASSKMAEFEKKELMRRDEQNQKSTQLYQTLQEHLTSIDTIIGDEKLSPLVRSGSLRDIITTHHDFFLESSTSLYEYDILKTLTLALKPTVNQLFDQWDPFDVSDTSLVEELAQWKTTLSSFIVQEYGELDYFQSLLYSLWYPKVTESFQNWSVSRPNLIITLLLDWEDVLDSTIIDHFIRTQIEPKILLEIDQSEVISNEDGPSVWVFEWLPFIRDTEQIKRQLKAKFDALLSHWTVQMACIPGIKGYKEIVGDSRFEDSIKRKLLPRLVSLLSDVEFAFDGGASDIALDAIVTWSQYLEFNQFEALLRHTVMNNWLRSLYHSIKRCQELKVGFAAIASSFKLWSDHFLQTLPSFKTLIIEIITHGLDMINKFIDVGVLSHFHSSHTVEEILNIITKDEPQQPQVQPRGIPIQKLQSSFKEVLEEYCTHHNLFISSQKGDLSTGKSLLKISRDVSGKNGLLAYIEEDVLFVDVQGDLFEPLSLDGLDERVL